MSIKYFLIEVERFKKKAILSIELLHLRVFGHAMSDEMRKFLRNISWSFGAGLLSAVIMFSANILAGRFLGPSEFGRYNFILSLATSVTFFFLLGNNQSSVRYISDRKHSAKDGRFLSALVFLTAVQSVAVLVITNIYNAQISERFGISKDILQLVLFLGLTFSFKELFDSFVRSLGLFKEQSLIKVGDALLVLASFTVFYFNYKNTPSSFHYAISMAIGAIFSIAAFFRLVRSRFSRFKTEEIVTIFHYNKFLILGGFSGLIMSLEKVFIGKYVSMESLGIYSAYYASSQMIISNLGIIFMNIFWPTVIKNKDSLSSVLTKLTRIFFRYFPIWIVLNFIGGSFFLSLYGRQYTFDLALLGLFSTASLLNIFFFVFMSIMNIDKIHFSIIVNTVVYALLVSSIIVFRSIPVYLVSQIVVYLVGTLCVRGVIMRDIARKNI